MRRIRLAPPAALAALLPLLVLAGAAPASAAPDPDAVYVFVSTPGDSGPSPSFGTASKADGALEALPEEYTATEPIALEILGDLGYAIVPEWNVVFTTTLTTWDPTSGEVLSSTAIVIDETTLPFAPGWSTSTFSFNGLDSSDGVHLQTVLCAWVSYPDNTGAEGCFLGTLDTASAAFTATADVTVLRDLTRGSPNELATDPLTGVSYLFDDLYDPPASTRTPYLLAVQAGVPGAPAEMTGLVSAAGLGRPLGADYAPDGTLWMSYAPAAGGQLLLSFAPGASLADAVPTVVGPLAPAAPDGPVIPYSLMTLAVESWTPVVAPPVTTPAATLPDTGPALGAGVAAALLLLAGGLTLLALLARRRA